MYRRLGKNGHRYWGKKGAGIIFTDGKHILLLKRSEGDEKDTWGIPGGSLEEGELDIDGAIREAKEECGNFEGQRVGKFEEIDGTHRWSTFIYRIDKPFKCELSNEHSDWDWFEFDELENLSLHSKFHKNWPSYLKLIKRRFKGFQTFKEWIADRLPTGQFD